MLKRKLVKLGKSSLVISLPKEWLRELDLDAGDELGIIVSKDGCLKIIPPKYIVKSKTNPIVINVSKCKQPRILERVLIGAYVVGKDPIIVESESEFSSSHLDEIRSVIDKIRGLEIIKESHRHIVLRTFLDPARYPLAGLLRRITNLTQTMIEYLLTAIREKNKDFLEEIIYLENEIDRIYFSALREIFIAYKDEEIASAVGIKSISELLSLRIAVKMFEILADALAELARQGMSLPGKLFSQIVVDAEVMMMLSDIKMAIDTITKTLIYGNVTLINELLNRIDLIRMRSRKIIELKEKGKLINEDLRCWLREVAWRLTAMLDTIRVVAELAINIAIDKTEKKFEC